MIDIKKSRNSFQKFPSLKQKCDPDIAVKKDNLNTKVIPNSSSTKTAAAPKYKCTTAAARSKVPQSSQPTLQTQSPSNPVREANQNFFLISAFKDKNFLKAECELAYAQVLRPPQTNKEKVLRRLSPLPPVADTRRVAGNCASLASNNNNTLRKPAALAAATNGMRRTGYGAHLVTTTPAATGLSSGSSGVAPGAAKKLNAVTHPSSYTSAKVGVRNTVVKPLVHKSSVATGVTVSSGAVGSSQSSHTNNNNNGSNNSLNSLANSGNNNMQASIDQEDIKFIDSDEPLNSAMATERKSQPACEQRCCLNHTQSAGASAKTRTRPKSTIICSTSPPSGHSAGAGNHMIFEKVNNYKYTNGSTSIPSAADAADRRCATAIDSHSIRASIEKFNSFSEQKRLPLSSVTLRSHSGGGSTSNLQHHRHSSDLDNCNLRLPNSGGGSLTRTPYRTSGAAVSLYAGTSVAAAAAAVPTRHALSNAPNSTGSLPMKSNKHHMHAGDAECSGLSSSVDSDVTKKKLSSISGGLSEATDESVRSATASLRTTLPPASPTLSRCWERDSSRSSLISSSTSHNHNDETKKAHDEQSEGLCGLRNIGNTCFMNSVIQCLSHTSELTKFLRNYNATKSPTSKDQQILYEFSKLIKDMWTTNVNSVTPMELKRSFSAKHRMYSDYNQQDAQEFLRFFLDSLHCALNTGVKGELLKIDDNLSDNKKAELTWEWYGRHENSLIRDLFVGQLKSTLRCTICGNTSVTFDPFWDLSVPLPSSSRCKLDACLDLFIREEILDGDEMPTCSKCQTRRKCTKSFTIQRFPKYLVIHLKRFSETRWSKLTNTVEFPTGERELNMGPYGANANSNICYSLYAISNHKGSTAGGHYVAICKHPVSKKWHEFNDNMVSEALSDQYLVSPSAYILFYERA